jgi:hypothetical protein
MNVNDTDNSDENEDFAAMLDEVPVNFEVCRAEIRPCKAFPKGATILAKQNGRAIFTLEVGEMKIDFACEQLDKDEVHAQAARYARNLERGEMPCTVLSCLVR